MSIFKNIASNFVKERVSNTSTAFKLIIADFKRYALILKYAFLVINCILLGLLVVYAVLDAILRQKENPNPTKKLRLIYAWSKIILNALALSSSLYSLYSAAASEIHPFSIVLSTLSMIMFIIKVVVEICLDVFASKWALLKNAMMMDAKEHPKTSGKIFSPFVGDIEEVEVKEKYAQRIKGKQLKKLK